MSSNYHIFPISTILIHKWVCRNNKKNIRTQWCIYVHTVQLSGQNSSRFVRYNYLWITVRWIVNNYLERIQITSQTPCGQDTAELDSLWAGHRWVRFLVDRSQPSQTSLWAGYRWVRFLCRHGAAGSDSFGSRIPLSQIPLKAGHCWVRLLWGQHTAESDSFVGRT